MSWFKPTILGLKRGAIQSLLLQAFGQTSIGWIPHAGAMVPLYVELQPSYQRSLGAPSKLYLTSATGELFPLKAVATWEESLGQSSLNRWEGHPTAKIHFSLPKSISPHRGLQQVERESARLLPEGVSAAHSDRDWRERRDAERIGIGNCRRLTLLAAADALRDAGVVCSF